MPEAVINKIAAGEVVERPASVVKELLENALDAGASRIRVAVRGGGVKSIRVEDNGEGMDKDSVLLAFERHSTSKLRSFSDLEKIGTLGFRGEALPSIAGVSQMELTSRPQGGLVAYRVQISGGAIRDFLEVGAPEGTTVSVRKLFFNTPARRKFLKSNQTEMAHIMEVVTARALAYPRVAFEFERDGQTLLRLPAVDDFRERMTDLWKEEVSGRLLPLAGESSGLILRGLIAPPELAGSYRKGIFFFVNKRPVRDRMVFSALMEAYGSRLPSRRYPMGVLFFEVVAGEVDVNIHPAKREVRFSHPSQVRRLVVGAVEKALREARPVMSFFRPEISPPPGGVKEEAAAFAPAQAEILFSSSPETAVEARDLPFAEYEILGQLKNTYLLVQFPDGLVLIDQHAAHERILYEQFRKDLEDVTSGVQNLLTPMNLELGPRESALLREQLPVLEKLGIGVEDFGGNTFIITSLPALLSDKGKENLVLDVLAGIEDWEKDPEDPREAVIIRLACLAALKAKKKLAAPEMGPLVEKLLRCRDPMACPHGRPTMLKFGWEELERRFGRR